MIRKKVKKKNNGNIDLQSSTQNLLLNIIIFVLFVVIIYLGYSIFIKLKLENENTATKNNNRETASEIIQIEVLNGCGVSGLADRFTDYLRNEGFDVVNKGNYIQFDLENTMIIDRIGNLANAKEVAKSLGVNESNIFTQINEDYFLDVSVILGADYYKLKPLN